MVDIKKMQGSSSQAAALLKALSHESRLLILCLLTQEEMCVGSLLKYTNLSQSAFSQQLSVLKKQGIIVSRKDSLNVFYKIKDERVLKILQTLHEIFCEDSL